MTMNFSLHRSLMFLETLIEYKHENDLETFEQNLSEYDEPRESFPFSHYDTHVSTTRLLAQLEFTKAEVMRDIKIHYATPLHLTQVWTS